MAKQMKFIGNLDTIMACPMIKRHYKPCSFQRRIMKIQQFRYSADNLSYLVYGSRSAIAIDAGATEEILEFADINRLEITIVTNTHSHPDHTGGNSALINRTKAQFIDCRTLKTKTALDVDMEKLLIYHTPGHLDDCMTFKAGKTLITGDTLFNGTIGNCFSGDMMAFFKSIKFLCAFAPDTIIYAGHDYVKDAMTYARIIEKNNPDIDAYLEKYCPDHVFSTLEDEFKVNPYLRFNHPDLILMMKQKGLPVETEFDRFNSLYEFG